MFRVLDDRPGSSAAISVAGADPLRVYVHVRASGDAEDLTGLHVLLTADLLVRVAELSGVQVLTARAFTGDPDGKPAMDRAAVALGIHPPVLPDPDLTRAWPDSPAAVHVTDNDAVGDHHGGILIRAAVARLAAIGPDEAAAAMFGGYDPPAIRLALMSVPRHQPAELTAQELTDASKLLSEWRRRVARWAEFPSGAIPESVAAALRTAFGDLDVAAALALLSGLAADEAVPLGPRFETFLYADRVLGLDLPRDIGRPATADAS